MRERKKIRYLDEVLIPNPYGPGFIAEAQYGPKEKSMQRKPLACRQCAPSF